MRIAMTGSHGLIGSALTSALEADGHTVTRLGREGAYSLADQDAVVNLAGAGIANKRWSDDRQLEIYSSRIGVTRRVVDALAVEAERGHSLVFLSGSAVGFYGSRASEELTETSEAGTGFLADVVQDWEDEAVQAHASHRTVLLRTGHVLAARGGLLGPQRPLFQLGLGGPLGNGTQFLSWITLEDYVRAAIHLLTRSTLEGPVNMTGPAPVRQRDFARAFGASLNRPAVLPTPMVAPRLLLGSEMVEELLLASQRALPNALLTDGFVFRHTEVQGALNSLR